MGVEIRTAKLADQTACMTLLTSLADATGGSISDNAGSTFLSLVDGSRGEILVAEEDGIILGMASVSYNLAMRHGGEYCQLEELIVDPQARGKNLGGQLVQMTVTRARARGCGDYGLYLVETTEHNRSFYEKYGFEFVGSEMRQQL